MTSAVYDNCTEVTPACPISGTLYGYQPNLGANVILLLIFATCGALQLGFGIYFRSWSFMVALFVGCFMELFGYVGRVQMRSNVWDNKYFTQQVTCLILAPSFIAAGLYLSLKHIIMYLGPEYSRLKPRLYTWIFVGCDILSILVQGAGGGIATGDSKSNSNLVNIGNGIMIAGIGIQVVTMGVCGLLAVDFAFRYRKQGRPVRTSVLLEKHSNINHRKFVYFCVAEIVAFTTVLTRCIYRLPELAGGWGNPLMRKEAEFLLLDGMMVAVAALAFTIFHPGFWFPLMTGRLRKQIIPADDHELRSSSSFLRDRARESGTTSVN